MSCDLIDITAGRAITSSGLVNVGAYSGGDQTCADKDVISEAIMEFSTGSTCNGQSGIITKAICRQYTPSSFSPNSADIRLYLFDTTWTPPAVNAAFDFAANGSAGDTGDCVGALYFAAADWLVVPAASRSGICQGSMVGKYMHYKGMPFKCLSTDTKLYGVAVNMNGGNITIKQNTVFTIELTFELA